jgi:hypothetical protein
MRWMTPKQADAILARIVRHEGAIMRGGASSAAINEVCNALRLYRDNKMVRETGKEDEASAADYARAAQTVRAVTKRLEWVAGSPKDRP